MLGVRPDGDDDVREAEVKTSDGTIYKIAKGRLELASPPNIDDSFSFGQSVPLRFASQSHADRWASEQRKRGFEVRAMRPGPVRTTFFTEPVETQKTLGGDEFFRALLYFGLTYLAHYFRDGVRCKGLDAAKAEIQRLEPVPLAVEVWWEDPKSSSQIPQNPFKHGHCVTIALEDSGRAKALISLWGEIHFGMEMGSIGPMPAIRVTTFIDPLADKPPNDIQVVTQEGGTLRLGSAEAGRSYLNSVVSGAVPHPMAGFLRAMREADAREAAILLYEKVSAACSMSISRRNNALMEAVSDQSQRIVTLIQAGVDAFLRTDLAPEIREFSTAVLRKLTEPDPTAERGLSVAFEATLHVVLACLADELRKRFDAGQLNVEVVQGLISEVSGGIFVFEIVANLAFKGSPN